MKERRADKSFVEQSIEIKSKNSSVIFTWDANLGEVSSLTSYAGLDGVWYNKGKIIKGKCEVRRVS